METRATLKPWASLSNLERREAIALRLGWVWRATETGLHQYLIHPNEATRGLCPSGMLPAWPTNDGLAFTEVWPRILHDAGAFFLGPAANGMPAIWRDDDDFSQLLRADTWADAICHAAYELLAVS